jgi:uncharacterized protein (TIGR03435 family)
MLPELKLGSDGYPDLKNQTVESAAIGRRVRLRLANASVADLIIRLERPVTQPVVDATDLKGKYDFTLFWIADDQTAVDMGTSAAADASDDLGPTLFEALQDQLGLRLQNAKGPIKVLMVDRMKQLPGAN